MKKSIYFRWDIYALLGLLLGITIILSITFLSPEPVASHGTPHAEFDGMKVGNDGALRIKGIEVYYFLFYASTILICIVLMILGVSPRYRRKKFWMWIGGVTILVLFSWWKLYTTYMEFLATGETQLFLGFPTPTAWMIYGLWGTASIFSIMYFVGFRKFIFTYEDEAELKEIVEAYAKEESES